jgi:hypothetical protein
MRGNTKRNITIKYKYDRINKTLTYGATIHKIPMNKSEPYDKKGHTETAEKRFQMAPVVVTDFVDNGNCETFNQKLRRQLFKHGVKAK